MSEWHSLVNLSDTGTAIYAQIRNADTRYLISHHLCSSNHGASFVLATTKERVSPQVGKKEKKEVHYMTKNRKENRKGVKKRRKKKKEKKQKGLDLDSNQDISNSSDLCPPPLMLGGRTAQHDSACYYLHHPGLFSLGSLPLIFNYGIGYAVRISR